MNRTARQLLENSRSLWEAWALWGHQRRRSLIVIASALIGILALTGLCIDLDLTRAEASVLPLTIPRRTETIVEASTPCLADIVIVYDESGSMEFDTLCYGCWEPVAGQMYPDGNIYPLHWSDTTIASADHCANACDESDYQNYDSTYEHNDCNYRHITHTDRIWIVIEAEEYSELSVDYHRYAYVPGKTYWVMQHNGHGAYYRDGSIRGAYLTHHPYYVADYGGLGVSCVQSAVENDEACKYGVPGGPFAAPRADYDFYTPQANQYYFWIRGQGGESSSDNHIFWGVNESSPPGSVGVLDGFNYGGINYDGADPDDWEWRQLGSDWLSQGNHTLNLWAGGAGFDVDRIIITTYNSTPPSTIRGADPNNGRTNWACASCDPRFAGRPGGQTSPTYRPDCNITDTRTDDIYDDEQPIRSALEAAKNWVAQLDPAFDQISYVRYDTDVVTESELECLRRRGAEALDDPACNPDWSNPGGEPPRDPDCGCFAGVITNTVIYELDNTHAGGSTNMGGAIKEGIAVLGTGAGHYGRPDAAHLMILMTDGQPTARPSSDPCDDDPNLWPEGDGDHDCVIYYAQQARDQGIVIHTISLGWSTDLDLMEEVADITGGEHFFAPSPDKLDPIFDALFLCSKVDFFASPISGLAPLTVVFTNTSTSNWVGSMWSFGDSITSTETNSTHTYGIPGVYTVSLTASRRSQKTHTLTRTSYITVVTSLPDFTPSYKATSARYADYGECITYTVAIHNSTGPLTHTILFTDTVPDGLSYIPGTLTATVGAITDTNAPTLRWSGILSPTPAVTITYAVTVSTITPQVIANAATIDASSYQAITRSTEISVNFEAPPLFHVELSADATNVLPGNREHEFIATVTDGLGQKVQGAQVNFSIGDTDEGGFSYSGTDPRHAESWTNALGQASVTLYGNKPGTATLRAWLDYDGDDAWDAGEPTDTANKGWTVSGPYITVSDHDVTLLDSIRIDVMNHDPADNPHRLLWCVVSGTNTSTVVQEPLDVDAGGDAIDLIFDIPESSDGLYRLETHSSGSGCDAGDLVAYSADIRVTPTLWPDLSVSITDPMTVCAGTPFTVAAEIDNLAPAGTDETFDVDFYVDSLDAPLWSLIGVDKQWVEGIGPNETVATNARMCVNSPGEHTLWARVDTTDYVEEEDENNNTDVTTFTLSECGEVCPSLPEPKPPGLRECQQLLHEGDFEGSFDEIYNYWNAGEGDDAYHVGPDEYYNGTLSMRLHAALGSLPMCESQSPWLYQTVQIPSQVYTLTTMTVAGQWFVGPGKSGCCTGSPEAADVLYLHMRDAGGDYLGDSVKIADGGSAGSWAAFEIDVSDEVNIVESVGNDVQVFFTATHDGDGDCTYFYLDALECEVCTEWPIPDDISNTASIGGDVRVLVDGIPKSMQGVDVWAYTQGGWIYHTTTIHDGSYHFYNVPPGTYTIYSEACILGGLYFATNVTTVMSNERNYGVDLLLQEMHRVYLPLVLRSYSPMDHTLVSN